MFVELKQSHERPWTKAKTTTKTFASLTGMVKFIAAGNLNREFLLTYLHCHLELLSDAVEQRGGTSCHRRQHNPAPQPHTSPQDSKSIQRATALKQQCKVFKSPDNDDDDSNN